MELYSKFFLKQKKRIKLATYANGTLTMKEVSKLLNTWESKEGFVPDVIIIDYADLLVSDSRQDFRHAQNSIWKDLRGLSQEKHCLVVTATQADANSYEKDTQTLKNFSEDKRKYAHVTAMYGMNKSVDGRDKRVGILRLNELVIREGDFDNTTQVYILQKLAQGRPVLGSFD